MTINREHFEAWLFSQPKDKQLDYTQGYPGAQPGCLFCNYLRDNFRGYVSVGGMSFALGGAHEILPNWFRDTVRKFSARVARGGSPIFTIAEAQAEYLKLFPDTTCPVVVPSPTPEKEMA